jgi:hypothetical protein
MAGCGNGLSGIAVAHLGQILISNANPLAKALRFGISSLDRFLCRIGRIEPFTNNPNCILRLGPERIRRRILLSDSVEIPLGVSIAGIHAWNGRLQQLAKANATLLVGSFLSHCFRLSLHLLVAYLEQNSQLSNVVSLHREFGFVMKFDRVKSLFEVLGFDVFLKAQPGMRFWRRAFWDNFFSCLFM